MEDVLYDPQTSGGLLLAVHPEDVPELLKRLADLELSSALIGSVTGKREKALILR